MREITVKGYAVKIPDCRVENAIIYLARIRFEEGGSIKLYYNCTKGEICPDKNCVFKSYRQR